MKLASIIAIALLLVAATLPATTACCTGQTSRTMTGMLASMPCCGDHCRLVKSTTEHENDATITPAASTDQPITVEVALIAPAVPTTTSFETLAPTANADSSPPRFLTEHQFRI